METSLQKRKVHLDVAGVSFNLITDLDENTFQEIHEMVQSICDQIVLSTKTPLTQKTAILAAFEATEKYIKLKQEHEAFKKEVMDRSQKALGTIDTILKSSPSKINE